MRRMENVTFYASLLIKFSVQNHSYGKIYAQTYAHGFSSIWMHAKGVGFHEYSKRFFSLHISVCLSIPDIFYLVHSFNSIFFFFISSFIDLVFLPIFCNFTLLHPFVTYFSHELNAIFVVVVDVA